MENQSVKNRNKQKICERTDERRGEKISRRVWLSQLQPRNCNYLFGFFSLIFSRDCEWERTLKIRLNTLRIIEWNCHRERRGENARSYECGRRWYTEWKREAERDRERKRAVAADKTHTYNSTRFNVCSITQSKWMKEQKRGVWRGSGVEGASLHLSPFFERGLSRFLTLSLSLFHVCVSVRTSTASPSSWTSYIDRFLTNLIGRYWLAHTHTSTRPMIRSLCLTGFKIHTCLCACVLVSAIDRRTENRKRWRGQWTSGSNHIRYIHTYVYCPDFEPNPIPYYCTKISYVPDLWFTIDNWFICNLNAISSSPCESLIWIVFSY